MTAAPPPGAPEILRRIVPGGTIRATFGALTTEGATIDFRDATDPPDPAHGVDLLEVGRVSKRGDPDGRTASARDPRFGPVRATTDAEGKPRITANDHDFAPADPDLNGDRPVDATGGNPVGERGTRPVRDLLRHAASTR